MTFTEFTANTKASIESPSPRPSPLELLTLHLRTAKLIQDEQKPLDIASVMRTSWILDNWQCRACVSPKLT
jgi:hypothetical protein